MRTLLALLSVPALLTVSACTTGRDIDLTPELRAVVDSNNAFTADLYGAAAAEGDENVFLSPFSVFSALGMTLAGAEGDTQAEISDVLHVEDESSFHENLGALSQDLDGRFSGYQIAVGNRLFGQKGLSWERDFLDITADDYGAELEEVDFQQDTEGARKDINKWVSRQTAGNIDELLEKGVLAGDTQLVLTNAIWFKGDWADAFQKDDTVERDFTLAAGNAVSAMMMSGTKDASFGTFVGGKVLSLPYKNDEVSMFAILPDAADGLAALEASLDGDVLTELLDGVSVNEVNIQLPRLELRQKLEMADLLADLGMPTAFSDAADFSAMISGGGIKLDKVVHEAWVLVDEEGTEAAAATGITGVPTSDSPEDPVEFFADHPFIFGIRDEVTGAILFMGRVADPTAQ